MAREPRPGEAGSIEQHLDMLETGKLRGDAIEHAHGRDPKDEDEVEFGDLDSMMTNYHVNMAERDREGDEMSGDDHSAGLQGGEPELSTQPFEDSGIPGDENRVEENTVDEREKKRAS